MPMPGRARMRSIPTSATRARLSPMLGAMLIWLSPVSVPCHWRTIGSQERRMGLPALWVNLVRGMTAVDCSYDWFSSPHQPRLILVPPDRG